MSEKEKCADGLAACSEGGGLYLHIAYCRRKCIYCDFFSAGDRIADWHRYVDALCAELEDRKQELAYPLRTIYIGGGTPSLMPIEEFFRLSDALLPYREQLEEFTIEVNPDDVNTEKLEAWKRGGVSRLSMGIQSFDDGLLSSIGRRHDAYTARRAYAMAREWFDNISIDLMFGLPGQTVDMWKDDLSEAISMAPEHISAYSLMYEEGTALTALRDNGKIVETPDEISERMFLILIQSLKNAGYERYETSNFALSGFRSHHNSSYWLQRPYLGLGPSAHSYDGLRTRRANKGDLRGYLDYWAPMPCDGKSMQNHEKREIYEEEVLTDEELRDEYILTRMRTCEGIAFDDFERRFGKSLLKRLKDKSNRLKEMGLVDIYGARVCVSESAVMRSDSVILELADLL